jgi:formylglycine-generating enzyme required for sulfatase activity
MLKNEENNISSGYMGMKKLIQNVFAALIVIFMAFNSFAAEKNNEKSAIKLVDKYVAVFDFEITAGDKSISRPLADSVIHEFSKSNKYNVIDRGNMNKILDEQKFQMSGCVAQECKVEAGQILGVGKIVSGSVGIVGKTYYLMLQLINVQTGMVELSAEDKCRCEIDDLIDSTKRLAKKILDEEAERGGQAGDTQRYVGSEFSGSREYVSRAIGAKFILIPAGTFTMGSPTNESGRKNDESQHQVTISKPFYMQTTEVTQGQWKRIMGNNPSYFSNCGDDCPVEQVSWNDIQIFIKKLNQQESTDSYRLPTEAEWEYAAKSCIKQEQYAGTSRELDLDEYAWYFKTSEGKTHAVIEAGWFSKTGHKKPNSLGLYNMSGNVWEWVQDVMGDYPTGDVTDPVGPSSGGYRIFRGGSWGDGARVCRTANRFYGRPQFRISYLGFRLAKTL